MKKRPTNFRIHLIAWCFMFVAPVAHAATYYVATTGSDTNLGMMAQPFRTIQRGINAAAASGDSLLVADGTYNEHGVDFGAKSLVVQSQSSNPAACILDCQLLANGIRINGGQATVSGLTIRNGNSPNNHDGGGMTINNASAALKNCIFTGNQAGFPGGLTAAALYVDINSNVTMTNCAFSANGTGNGVGSGSGVLLVAGGSATLLSCSFANNTTSGLFQAGGNCTLSMCAFAGNSASFGGGIYQDGGTMQVTGCTFDNNRAVNYGATIQKNSGDLTISSSLISHTQAYGIIQFAGGVTITNSTLVTPALDNAGLANLGGAMTIANSIVWGGNSSILTDLNAVTKVTYSNVRGFVAGSYPGIGNISADPLFVNEAAGDYHLQPASPCIDTGSAAAPNLPTTDLDGGPRVLGRAPDMGAYEFWSSAYGLYVDKALGSDANPGSPLAPFKTVTKAVTVAGNGSSIYIRQGNYGTDTTRITKALRLFNWGNAGLARIGKP